MNGTCTKCGFAGRLYYAKPTYQWCENCIAKTVVDTYAKVRRCTSAREWREANKKLAAALNSLRKQIKVQAAQIADLQERLGRAPKPLSISAQIRQLPELTSEALSAIVGDPETVRRVARIEKKRRAEAFRSFPGSDGKVPKGTKGKRDHP